MRLAGQYVIHPGSWAGTLVLLAVSFALMAWVLRQLCGGLSRDRMLAGAVSVAPPTLLLDPFSCAFFFSSPQTWHPALLEYLEVGNSSVARVR